MTASPKSKPQDLDLIASLEERLLHVWPAVTTHMINGWAIRFAGGYTGRANSASAIAPGARVTEKFVATITDMYEQESLPPQFRISPVAHADAANVLKQHGFVSRGPAHTMVAQVDAKHASQNPRVHLSHQCDMSWCLGVTSRQEKAKRNPDALHAIVTRIKVPVQFATVKVEGEAIGFGVAAIDRGWMELGSIVIDAEHRGQGLGRALVSTLLGWALKQNVQKAFLQVDVTNVTALGLYRSLGFQVLYDYDTLFLPARESESQYSSRFPSFPRSRE